MKRVRLFLATAAIASAFVVGGAGPAHASCIIEPVNPCVIVCRIGYGNPTTQPYFRICTIL